MSKKQTTIGVVVALVLTSAVGIAVGSRQAKSQAKDTITALEAEKASLKEKLQQTESDLAALVRTASQPKIIPTAPAPTSAAAPAVADPGLTEELEARDEQIASLKQQLAEVPTNRAPRSREDWEQRMEDWRKENPEEYQRMQEERQQRRQELAQRTTDRFQFFSEVPTDGLSDEYLANHQALLDRMQFMNDAMAQIAADPDSEASQQIRRDMRENLRGTHEMLEMEKEVLVNDLLTGVGVSDQQATEVMDYMNYIDEMTSMGGFFGRGGGRPGGGGGGRGGR